MSTPPTSKTSAATGLVVTLTPAPAVAPAFAQRSSIGPHDAGPRPTQAQWPSPPPGDPASLGPRRYPMAIRRVILGTGVFLAGAAAAGAITWTYAVRPRYESWGAGP